MCAVNDRNIDVLQKTADDLSAKTNNKVLTSEPAVLSVSINNICIISLSSSTAVFLNLCFEAESFAEILLAHGTHGAHSPEFVLRHS